MIIMSCVRVYIYVYTYHSAFILSLTPKCVCFFDTNSDGTGLCFERPKSDLPWRSPSSNAGYVGRSRPPQQPDHI